MKERVKDFFSRDRKTLYIILSIVLISVFSLTIVYAALSVTLNITGNAEVVASSWDIHLDNAKVKSGSVNNNVPSISNNNLSFSATLTTPGDFYEFTVDVVNGGSIDAMIDSVIKTPELSEEQDKYIKYEVSYQNGESINTKQIITKGTTMPIKVRIEYRKDLVASDLPSTSTTLDLKLTLVYVQSDGTGTNVKDNGAEMGVRVVSGDGTQVGNEVCIGEECFYVISSDTYTVTMLSKYNLHVGNSIAWDGVNDPVITSLASPTGIQDSTAIGGQVDSEGNPTGFPWIGITAFSNTDSTYSVSVVEGYVNSYNSYLVTQGVTPLEARLITKDELINLGCSEDDGSCSSAPSWVYATSYWSGSAIYTDRVWYVIRDLGFSYGYCNYVGLFGVRPVITITKDLINGIDSGIINVSIDGVTYKAVEGMKWGEWVDSQFNTAGLEKSSSNINNELGGSLCYIDGEYQRHIYINNVIDSSISYSYCTPPPM